MSISFEDAFMEAQANAVSLCMEFLDITQTNVEKIYIYMYSDEGAFFFNAFFGKKKQIISITDLADIKDVRDFMRCGIEDVMNIRNVCKTFNKNCPYEIKMIFDIQSHKFDAAYRYEPLDEEKDIAPDFRFMGWWDEIEKSLND